MKIIDLAEKQINNEILPKHIRYKNEDLYFDGVTYYDKEGYNDLFDILAMDNNALTHLYDEVVIIEEPKTQVELTEKEYLEYLDKIDKQIRTIRDYIPKSSFLKLEEEKKIPEKLTNLALTHNNRILVDKINEIIDYLNSKGE